MARMSFGIGMTVSPDVVVRGETADATVTFRMLDGGGTPRAGATASCRRPSRGRNARRHGDRE